MVRWKRAGIIVGAAWAAATMAVAFSFPATGTALLVAAVASLAVLISLRLELASAPRLNQTPQTLIDSERLLQALGDAVLKRLPDAVLVLDAQGRVQRVSPAAKELLGENPIDRPLAAFMRAPHLLDAIDAVANGADLQIIEMTLRVPVERHLQVKIARIDTTGTKRSALMVLFHDMTAVKRAERLRADFIANASHELKTPLTVLSGFIETLEGPAREDPVARTRFLGIMRDQSIRMGRLVNDLLSLSRIELNEHLAPKELVDLGAIIHDVADSLSVLAKTARTSIDIKLPPRYPMVLGDREDLVQAVQNLIENAIKYGKPDRPIDVSLAESDQGGGLRLALSVRDYGDGIAREHIPRLTERFYSVDAVRSRERGGTGLGLAIVKHIVNRHRGQLAIESTLGEGSTFSIILPALADQSAPGGEVAPGPVEGNKPKADLRIG
jgi:two-component system phosphate regulon sensor histidine kinase PhoR